MITAPQPGPVVDPTFEAILDTLLELAEVHHEEAHERLDLDSISRWQAVRDHLVDASQAAAAR